MAEDAEHAGEAWLADAVATRLLRDQPVPHGCPCLLVETLGQATAGVQRMHGQRGDPRREVRVDRPAAIFADGPTQEIERPLHDRMRRVARRDETHGDKAGQRGGFQESAVARLE